MSTNRSRSISRLFAATALTTTFVTTAAGQGIAAAVDLSSQHTPTAVAASTTHVAAARIKVHGSLDATRVTVGQVFHLRLKVSPGKAGQRVQWQVLTPTGWSKGGTVRLRAGGTVNVALRGTRAGKVTLRGYAPASAGRRAGASAPLSVTITAAPAVPTPPAPPPNAGQPPAPEGGKYP